MISVRIVEVNSPPITTRASGRERKDPSLRPRAMGVRARIVATAVMRMGRSRLRPPSMIALWASIPWSRYCSTRSSSTMALVTTIPISMSSPIRLGMPSLIGLLMLIGIVVTNAIVLLDLVEQYRDQGMDAQSAIMEGGRRRLRPILMTAVATILALTPMALGLSEGSFLSRPLALVVIGGLFTSTILTLIIVPVVYLTFDRFRKRDNLPV